MSEKQEHFTLLGGRVICKRGIYNPTSDAVWLAAYAPKNVKTVLDIGIGTGGISLCLLTHNPDAEITGIDISPEMLELCQQNFDLNNKKIKLEQQDILQWRTPATFDLVITNPPYFSGTPTKKHAAHHNVDIEKWIQHSMACVKPGGYFCTIVDALLVSKIAFLLERKRFGNIQIFPLFGAKKSAERVLIRAKQGIKTGSTIFCGSDMKNVEILRAGLTVDDLLATLGKQ